ncbi:MAG: hypothetical protein HXX11_07230 [Desulfuromonadales bacterium]|nr:hypothetical protein [Desulfuromonadales bacterium]
MVLCDFAELSENKKISEAFNHLPVSFLQIQSELGYDRITERELGKSEPGDSELAYAQHSNPEL